MTITIQFVEKKYNEHDIQKKFDALPVGAFFVEESKELFQKFDEGWMNMSAPELRGKVYPFDPTEWTDIKQVTVNITVHVP